jgi:hypothetical protein
MPSYSLDKDLYCEHVNKYLEVRNRKKYDMYINSDGSAVNDKQIWYLYTKISKHIGVHVTPAGLRKQAVRTVAKMKGIQFVNKLLKHKKFDSTLYIVGKDLI